MPSETSSGRVRLIAERPLGGEELLPSSGAAVSQPAPADRPSTPSSASYHEQTLATLAAIARVLNARILVLVALLASFVLALLTVLDPSNLKLFVNLAFDLTVLCPLVALYALKG